MPFKPTFYLKTKTAQDLVTLSKMMIFSIATLALIVLAQTSSIFSIDKCENLKFLKGLRDGVIR